MATSETEGVCKALVYVLRGVQRQIATIITVSPADALQRILIGPSKKPALKVDSWAEITFRLLLARYNRGRFSTITVLGEESLMDPNLDLAGKSGIFALVDALDGTDLLERGLSNWCSAVVLFRPSASPGERILAAFVALPNNDIYFATCDESGAFVQPGQEDPRRVRGPSRAKSLEEATICFYGQKVTRLEAFCESGLLRNLSNRKNSEESGEGKSISTRIHVLGGNPMMVRLADHRTENASGIDAVFELRGQRAHDFLPGVYVAKKAGAVLTDLDGNDIDDVALEGAILRPSSRLSYVLTATRELGNKICSALMHKVPCPAAD